MQLEENVAVVSDSFWYVVSKYFKRELTEDDSVKQDVKKLPEEEYQLLKGISRNYINLFLTIDHKDER